MSERINNPEEVVLDNMSAAMDPISQVQEYKVIPKYNLSEMFKEPESTDYKVHFRYDSLLEVSELAGMQVPNKRISTRSTEMVNIKER